MVACCMQLELSLTSYFVRLRCVLLSRVHNRRTELNSSWCAHCSPVAVQPISFVTLTRVTNKS